MPVVNVHMKMNHLMAANCKSEKAAKSSPYRCVFVLVVFHLSQQAGTNSVC